MEGPQGASRLASHSRASSLSTVDDCAVAYSVRRRRRPPFQHNSADPLIRRTRMRPDHNRVRDAPSPVSVLGLAPPPPATGGH